MRYFGIKWDARFLQLAQIVSTWSKDPSTKVGAVLVRPDKTIAATGYNGFPMGCSDSDAMYEDRDEKLGRVVHAELNCCLAANENCTGYTIYIYPPSAFKTATCDRCAAAIIQRKIHRVVSYYDINAVFKESWRPSFDRSLRMYQEAGVLVDAIPLLP